MSDDDHFESQPAGPDEPQTALPSASRPGVKASRLGAETSPQEPEASRLGAEASREQYVFDLDGGRACLDFANTLGSSSSSTDHLTDFADLVAFATQSDLLTPADADWLRAQGHVQPAVAASVLTRAKRLRGALRAIFSNVAAGTELREAELAELNTEVAAAMAHARVVPAGDGDGDHGSQGYRWGWSGRALDAPLWPITRSAADLLTSDEERALVRECGADDCAWLFMDTTRNRSRQWCSMQGCGNREKARRHYQRRRARRGAAETSDTSGEAAARER
jgi:predicted RNA-binding Zn ribbon-like protein